MKSNIEPKNNLNKEFKQGDIVINDAENVVVMVESCKTATFRGTVIWSNPSTYAYAPGYISDNWSKVVFSYFEGRVILES